MGRQDGVRRQWAGAPVAVVHTDSSTGVWVLPRSFVIAFGFPGFNGVGLLSMMTVFDWKGDEDDEKQAKYWPQQTFCVLNTILWMMVFGLSVPPWALSRPLALCSCAVRSADLDPRRFIRVTIACPLFRQPICLASPFPIVSDLPRLFHWCLPLLRAGLSLNLIYQVHQEYQIKGVDGVAVLKRDIRRGLGRAAAEEAAEQATGAASLDNRQAYNTK